MKNLLLTVMLAFFIFPACPAAEDTGASLEKAVDQEFKWLQEESFNAKVVTATRTEISLLKAAKSISVVNTNDMENAQDYFLPEIIDNIPGVFLKRTGGPGQISKINMRGAEHQYVQFQYNGVVLKDAADSNG